MIHRERKTETTDFRTKAETVSGASVQARSFFEPYPLYCGRIHKVIRSRYCTAQEEKYPRSFGSVEMFRPLLIEEIQNDPKKLTEVAVTFLLNFFLSKQFI